MKLRIILVLLTVALFSSCRSESLPVPVDKDVTFKNGDVELSGTLSLPDKNGSFPAIVMITGSGPQNRDEEVFGFKIFKNIADTLVKQGIAVLRYDDRGVGKSTGDRAISDIYDFTGDAKAALNFLRTRKEIDQKKIGVFGHSEGGLVAMMLAAEDHDVAFVVLMAAPGVRGDKIINSQVETINKAAGKTQDEINEILAFQNKIYDVARKYDPEKDTAEWNKLTSELVDLTKKQIEKLPDSKKAFITDIDAFAKAQAEKSLAQVKSKWFKSLITIDPAEYLKKIKCPVLAIFGELDTQVPPALNKAPMEKALKESGTKYNIVLISKANHLFQEAKTGQFQEYSSLKKEFAPGFIDTISSWIKEQVK